MPLIDVAYLRSVFAISEDIADTRLTPFFGRAAVRVRGWVGAEAYADAAAETPDDAERAEALLLAEAHLAFSYALLGLNSPLTTQGVVLSRSEESTARVQYLNPAQIQQLQQQYLDAAEQLCRPYALADGTPDPQFDFTEGF